MSKFRKFLDDGWGRAQRVAEELGVSAARVNRIKYGAFPMPVHWINPIVRMSGGELTHRDLIPISSAKWLEQHSLPRTKRGISLMLDRISSTGRYALRSERP